MNKQIEQVLDWHRKCAVPIGNISVRPEIGRIKLRCSLIEEESRELIIALKRLYIHEQSKFKSERMSDVLKEICDIIYVCHGTLIELGLHNLFEKAFNEVHNSNMTKTMDNKSVNGKILKGPNFKPANIEKLFFI